MRLPLALIVLAWALVSYVLYAIVASVLNARRHAALAREWECQDPPVQKNRLPFGIDQVMRGLKANRETISH
jgi:hypothetical protein